jgi:hypothetical protein
VSLRSAQISGQLDVEGKASFARALNADNLSVGTDLNIGHGYFGDPGSEFGGDVTLNRAKVGGQLDISNSVFAGRVSADSLSVGDSLFMHDGTTFDGDVSLGSAKVGGQLGISNSVFAGRMSADSLSVGDSLFMRDGTKFDGDVSLRSAKVGGQLSMIDVSFAKTLDTNNLRVGSSLYMRGGTFGGQVYLGGAKVGGQLDMSNSTFGERMSADYLSVGSSLVMRDATFGGDVRLVGARVSGQVGMEGNTSFAKTLNAESLSVGTDLFMRDGATFDGDVLLHGARVGGTVDMRHASINGRMELSSAAVSDSLYLTGATTTYLNFIGAVVAHELNIVGLTWRCPTSASPLNWTLGDLAWQHPPCGQADNETFLTLRNMQVGVLQDSDDAWPPSLDLEGFHYERLGGLGGKGQLDMRARPPEQWRDWLARDPMFSTQPYVQLAGVLQAAGHRDSADRIQYAGRQRERDEALRQAADAWRRGDAWIVTAQLGQWVWLTALCVVTGYGVGLYTFRVLYWVLGLTVVGGTVLWFSPTARKYGIAWRLGASLHRLLPVVELNKEFKDFFENPAPARIYERRNLSAFQAAFFAGIAITGWVLGIFLLAALGGLMSKG